MADLLRSSGKALRHDIIVPLLVEEGERLAP